MKPVSGIPSACFAVVVAVSFTGCEAEPAPGPDSGPLHPEVSRIFADIDRDEPGAAVAVLSGGTLVHRAGYGLANLDHGIPITPSTVFDIASISKQFGAMAALLLEEEGDLDLDADAATAFFDLDPNTRGEQSLRPAFNDKGVEGAFLSTFPYLHEPHTP